jgi:hypothetical protein
VFDYGAKLAAVGVDQSDVWPGAWAPPMVKAGWKGTNLAAYETDFYHGLVFQTPEFRTVYGAGEKFLSGIHQACTPIVVLGDQISPRGVLALGLTMLLGLIKSTADRTCNPITCLSGVHFLPASPLFNGVALLQVLNGT